MSIACCLNVYREADALPGALESAASFFDAIHVIHASPNGKPSDDGTMEILDRWGIKPIMEDISQGFGVIRTKLLHGCGCDWGYLMDADERFHRFAPIMTFSGSEKYPDTMTPNVATHIKGSYDQGALMRSMVESAEGFHAIVCRRRHWMTMGWDKPAQNGDAIPDWQCRLMRNNSNIGFDPNVKLHERIVAFNTGGEPEMIRQTMQPRAIFFDHYHPVFKARHADKNKEDMATYKLLDEKSTQGMWLEKAEGVKV